MPPPAAPPANPSLPVRSPGPARILAYICRPRLPPTPSTSPSSASSPSSSPSIVSHPPGEEAGEPYDDYSPELEPLDHLYLHLPPNHPSPAAALERALSSAAARHRYRYHAPGPNNQRHSFRHERSGGSPDADADADAAAAALASTDIRACDVRINLRQPPKPTVFGPLPLCASWMRPLSTLGEAEFRGVLFDVAQNREVAEVIVLLRPAVVHSDGEEGDDDQEAEGSDVDGDDDSQESPDIYSSAPSTDSTDQSRGRSRSRRHSR